MGTDSLLNVSIFLIFLLASIMPFYFAKKLGRSGPGILSAVLGVFLILHGFYHLSEYIGNGFLSDIVIEPLSAATIFAFASYLYWRVK